MSYMKLLRYLFFITILFFLLHSCNKDNLKKYDNPFFYIEKNGESKEIIYSEVDMVSEYFIYFSSKALKKPVNVFYNIKVGNGLKEYKDYIVLNKLNKITFLPGIYQMPIRIKWLPKKVKEGDDNSITIKITSNSMNYNIGLPGKDKKQSSFVITKINN